MKVSIIIPVHKITPYLKDCVLSALHQTYDNLELLIVCNGGMSIEICRQFLNIKDKRLFILHSKSGRDHARNKGLEMMTGDFVQFLDYDDILFSHKIAAQIEVLKNCSEDCFSITKWKKFSNSIDDHYIFPFNKLFTDNKINGAKLIDKLSKGGFVATAAWLIPKQLTANILWIDSPNDDAVFLSEIIKTNPNILMVSHVLVGYRTHGENTSSIRSKKELKKIIQSWEIIKINLSSFNTVSLNGYLFKAFEYLLQYSKEVNYYKTFIILTKLYDSGLKSKVSIFKLIKKTISHFR